MIKPFSEQGFINLCEFSLPDPLLYEGNKGGDSQVHEGTEGFYCDGGEMLKDIIATENWQG